MSETYYFESATIQLVLNNCREHINPNFQTGFGGQLDYTTLVKSILYLSIGLYHICQNYLRDSASSFHWLSSSIFSYCRLFVRRPASVTSPLISTI